MKTAVRLDDINPEMNYANFNRIKGILDAAGLKPLIGVVPFNKDKTLKCEKPHDNFSLFLQTLQTEGWNIALHGYNHLYTTNKKGMFPINCFSEFAGVDEQKQCRMISEGVNRLKEWGVNPVAFMAPGHSFDKNTLRALKAAGIEKITDGFGSKPYIRDGIVFYPISKKRSECISNREGYSTYVIHADTMTDKDIETFEKMIMNNRDKFISYDEYMSVEAQKRGMLGNCAEYLLALAKHLLISRKASEGTVIHSAE